MAKKLWEGTSQEGRRTGVLFPILAYNYLSAPEQLSVPSPIGLAEFAFLCHCRWGRGLRPIGSQAYHPKHSCQCHIFSAISRGPSTTVTARTNDNADTLRVMGKKMPPAVKKWLQEAGREYGKKGGERRRSNLTPERRSAIARAAALARWKKRKA